MISSLVPAEVLEVLHPLEVGDDHAAGVGEQVGHDQSRRCRVSISSARGGGGAVGALHDHMAAHASRRCPAWIMPPSAAGTNRSQEAAAGRPGVIASAPSNSVSRPPSAHVARPARGRRCRRRSCTAPVASETPTIVAPRSCSDPRRPTSPRCRSPGSTNRAFDGSRPSRPARLEQARSRPARWRPRARPSPRATSGLPVTIAGVWPCSLPYSSMNQAMTCALVPTSGAGMSRRRARAPCRSCR